MEVNIKLKVKEGDECIARNYRSKFSPWENGIVTDVTIGISEELNYRVSYRVRLDRIIENVKRPWKNHHLFITVGDDSIAPNYKK